MVVDTKVCYGYVMILYSVNELIDFALIILIFGRFPNLKRNLKTSSWKVVIVRTLLYMSWNSRSTLKNSDCA